MATNNEPFRGFFFYCLLFLKMYPVQHQSPDQVGVDCLENHATGEY